MTFGAIARAVGLGACIAAALVFAAGAGEQTGPKPEAQPLEPADAGPLVAEGPEPDLFLLYTGGVAGYVEPCG